MTEYRKRYQNSPDSPGEPVAGLSAGLKSFKEPLVNQAPSLLKNAPGRTSREIMRYAEKFREKGACLLRRQELGVQTESAVTVRDDEYNSYVNGGKVEEEERSTPDIVAGKSMPQEALSPMKTTDLR